MKALKSLALVALVIGIWLQGCQKENVNVTTGTNQEEEVFSYDNAKPSGCG